MKSVILFSYCNTLAYVFNTLGLQTVVLWATFLFIMSSELSELNALGYLITLCCMLYS